MAPNARTSVPSAGLILDRLRMSGKKTVVACALTLIMLSMWVRVFIGHRPAAAAAAPPQPTEVLSQKTPVPVQRVELPKSPGRHDCLQRNFFAVTDLIHFRRNAAGRNTGTDKEVSVTSPRDVQEVIQRVARTLKLEAVLWSESPRAFINDQLLRVGDKLLAKNGTASYEFEVLQIHVDSVLVEGSGIRLTLKLAQHLEVIN